MLKTIKKRANGRLRVQQKSNKPSMTETSHTKQVNINSIMKKYFRTGLIEQRQGANYGDFSNGLDYHGALNKVLAANEDFQQLPSEIRTMFNNDPAQLIDFLNNPDNYEEAVKAGLIPLDPAREQKQPESGISEPVTDKQAETAAQEPPVKPSQDE